MYNPYIVGNHVYLRHPTLADVEGVWHEWMSDEETTRWLNLRYWPNCIENQKEFYESNRLSKDRMVLSIVDIESDKHIGICNLSNISWLDGYCDLAVVMGDKNFRKGPHGLESYSLLIKIAFLRLNFRIIKSAFTSTNEAAKAAHDIFHFKEVGRLEELLWDRGKYVDSVIVMLKRDDWMNRNSDLKKNSDK